MVTQLGKSAADLAASESNDKKLPITSDVISDTAVDKQVTPTEVPQVQQQFDSLKSKQGNTTPGGSAVEVEQHLTVQPITEGHTVTITPNLNGKFKWKAVCNCAWQGLFDIKDEAIERAKYHKKMRNVKPF